ncbi:MAG: PEP-CTERM sorting domain-containing protein [Planctomycetota bacterium]|jgi:probable HAF family extracellular repeat protein
MFVKGLNGKCLFVLLCVVFLSVIGISATAGTAKFQGLGDLPGGLFGSSAAAVSADGTVVVGFGTVGPTHSNRYKQAFRWTKATGMVSLAGVLGTFAKDVSDDGLVVVGYVNTQMGNKLFRWTSSEGLVELGGWGYCSAVSGDGTVVAGFTHSLDVANGYNEAFVWTAGSGIVRLGCLPGASTCSSYANGVSRDGSVVVGSSASSSGGQAFRWTEGGGMAGLGYLPGGESGSGASDASRDGSVIVGQSLSSAGYQPFRWTQATGMVGLGHPPSCNFSGATGVSSDGRIVVGWGQTGSNPLTRRLFIWSEESGMRDVVDVLENDYGLDLGGWTLSAATGISADGRTIVGDGTNPDGDPEAWRAEIPRLCVYALGGDLNGDCRANFLDFGLLAENWLADCYLNPDDPACIPK